MYNVETKGSLTPEEKIKVAHFHLIVGWKQHDLAAFLGVNSGRIAEAVTAVRKAVDWNG